MLRLALPLASGADLVTRSLPLLLLELLLPLLPCSLPLMLLLRLVLPLAAGAALLPRSLPLLLL